MRHERGLVAVLGVGLLVAAVALVQRASGPQAVPVDAPAPARGASSQSVSVRQDEPSAPVPGAASIRGTIRDARGPVAGATVFASRTEAGESLSELTCVRGFEREVDAVPSECVSMRWIGDLVAQRQGEVPLLAQAVSGAGGTFLLDGLEPGSYSLWVESPQGVGLLRDVALGQQEADVVLGAGSRLSGGVTDEQRKPVAGARVTAVFTAHSRYFEALTDAQGQYHLGPLPRGEYVLVASQEGLTPAAKSLRLHPAEVHQSLVLSARRTVTGQVVDRDGRPVVDAAVSLEKNAVRSDARGRFTFEGLSAEDHVLTANQGGLMGSQLVSFRSREGAPPEPLAKEVTVPLTTPFAELEGVVRDAAGQPVADALVRLFRSQGCMIQRNLTKTDARGAFHFGPLSPGKVHLSVSADDDRLFTSWEEKISEGTRTVELIAEFVPRVEGVLVDARGQPVAGEHVSLHTRPGEPEWSLPGESGPDGRFSLRAFRPGPLLLRVGEEAEEDADKSLWTQEVPVPAADLRVVIATRSTVEGEVVDEEGRPVAQALVSLGSESATDDALESGTTDARGRFSLRVPRPGRYRVTAELEDSGFAHATTRVVNVGTESLQVRLAFEAGHPLSGLVVDLRGRPVVDVEVAFQSEYRSTGHAGYEPAVRARTGADGRFHFASVSGDATVLSVTHEDFVVSDAPLVAGLPELMRLEPAARDVRIVLARKATLSARIVRGDGSPVTSFTVNGDFREDEEGLLEWPITRTGPLTLEISTDEDDRPAAGKRTVSVRLEEDRDLGVITLR